MIQSDLVGMVKRPFKGLSMVKYGYVWLSDLQLGDKKVTLNHLASNVFFFSGLLFFSG